MNDLFYEIIMQSSILITGLDKQNLLYNLFLTIFGLYDMPELHIIDLAGQSSKYERFSPAIYAPSEILDTLSSIHVKMCARIDSTAYDTAKPIYMYIHNFDSIISQFYGKEKKEVMRIISDMVNRGECANMHIIITADKCTSPLFSDFKSRVYAGKTDKKTAQKYFGTIAHELSNFDCSDFGQAMSTIDGTIYKFNVPEIPENDIDSIMQELTGSADIAPVCPVNAPTVRPEHIRIKSHVKRTAPTETAVQPIQAAAQQPDAIPEDTDKNIIALFLSAIINLISGVFSRISAVKTRPFLVKIPAAILLLILNFLLIPTKILYAVATSSGGSLVICCTAYMIACAAVQIVR